MASREGADSPGTMAKKTIARIIEPMGYVGTSHRNSLVTGSTGVDSTPGMVGWNRELTGTMT